MTLYLACVSLNGIQGSGKGMKTLNAMQAVGGRGVQPDLAPTDFSIPLSEAAFIRRIFQYVEGINQNITDERNSVELKKFITHIYIYIYISVLTYRVPDLYSFIFSLCM